MKRSQIQIKFKITKGELVNIVSAVDIPMRLERDLHITSDRVNVLRSGEVLVKLTGMQFIVRPEQLKRQQESFKDSPRFLLTSWDSEEREESKSLRSSNFDRNYGRVSYVHSGRPTGDGRVIRSVNNW